MNEWIVVVGVFFAITHKTKSLKDITIYVSVIMLPFSLRLFLSSHTCNFEGRCMDT